MVRKTITRFIFPFFHLDVEEGALLLLSILINLGVYWFRNIFDETFGGAGIGLMFLIVGISPIVVMLSLLLLGYTIWILVYSYRESSFPIIVLLLGFIVAILLPIFPGPAERAFITYRTNYSAIVELARQGKLEHGSCLLAYMVPEEYQVSDAEVCIAVHNEPAFVVEFFLPSSYHTLAYVEKQEALSSTLFCDGVGGSKHKQLDDHWYLCTPSSG